MEVIVIVCALCMAYPNFVHVNRGNHEDLALSVAYGLAAEVQHKYGASIFRNRLVTLLDSFFASLPVATVVDQDALIVHAGPPPPGVLLSDVQLYMEELMNEAKYNPGGGFSRTIQTHTTDTTHPHTKAQEVMEALLWSDPAVDDDEKGRLRLADYHGQINTHGAMLGWVSNVSRGAGYKYDSSIVRNVLHAEGLHRLVRSHEPVHQGCVRYAIPTNSKEERPMEFFTVFSASHYPYKEGYNQGAVLKLRPNGNHAVIRYATEEDEPLVGSSFTSFHEVADTTRIPLCQVDSASLRRALREAVASRRSELTNALESLAEKENILEGGIPFDKAVDVLIQTLQLDESGLNKPGARMALARALSIKCHDTPPQTVDLLGCIDALVQEADKDDDFVPEMVPYYPWLRTVFELVDVNHDGVLSRSEWLAAVDKINSKLPKGTRPIDAEETWELLDFNGDGRVSSSEWDALGKALCR